MVRQADGSYLIGTYHEIAALLHDPRISVDPHTRGEATHKPPFLRLDDPEHHRLRTLAMRPFGPPHSPGRVDAMRGEIDRITKELLEPFEAGRRDRRRRRLRLPAARHGDLPLARRTARGRTAVPGLVRRSGRSRRRQARRGHHRDGQGRQPGADRAGRVPGEPRRAAPWPPDRRHALRLRQRAGPGPAAHRGGTRGNRHPAAHRRTRDHGQPDHQRGPHPAAPARAPGPAASRTRPAAANGGGTAALRTPGPHPRAHPARRHRRRRRPRSPKAPPSYWRWPRATATPSGSTSPTGSTPPARTTSTSASAAASTCATGHPSPASRPRPHWARCSPNSARHAWSRTRRPTGRTPCSAGRATCPSNSELSLIFMV